MIRQVEKNEVVMCLNSPTLPFLPCFITFAAPIHTLVIFMKFLPLVIIVSLRYVIHVYHKIILHAVESRSVNVPLIVAATVPSIVVVILVSLIIVTFTITVYKQRQKYSTNEGNNLYDVINLNDIPPVPPALPPPNVKFQNIAYDAQQFKSDEKNWDMNENESYQKPLQHDNYEQVEVNLETHTSDPNYLEVIG